MQTQRNKVVFYNVELDYFVGKNDYFPYDNDDVIETISDKAIEALL